MIVTISGGELADVVRKRYGGIDYEWGFSGASTRFVSRTKMTCQRGNKLILTTLAGKHQSMYPCISIFHMLFTDTVSVMPALHPGFCMYLVSCRLHEMSLTSAG